MIKQRLAYLAVVLSLLCGTAAQAFAAPKETAPAQPKAGIITALLPTAHIKRGLGKTLQVLDAKKGDSLQWQDLVTTDKGGRARITLEDQSILSLGSQAELRIMKHDAKSQQTALQLGYGRVRAEVASITRDGGKFEVRTPTAVAGVIGTDFGSDSSVPGVTTFICISGLVQVGNSDPNVPGSVPCAAGQTTEVKTGMAPSTPKQATPQQINQLIQDTEPARISAFTPGSALVGSSIDAQVTGSKMAGINKVEVKSVTGAGSQGVTATLTGPPSDTSIGVRIVVAKDAPAGPRTITFTKSNGQATAAMFTVLAPAPPPQTLDAASLRKRYVDLLDAAVSADQSSAQGIRAGVNQAAQIAQQTLDQLNGKLPQPLSLAAASTDLNTILGAFAQQTPFKDAATQAYATATASIDAAIKDELTKVQNGESPADAIAALDKKFQDINTAFQGALTQGLASLSDLARVRDADIEGLIAKYTDQINQAAIAQLAPPTPKVNKDEISVDLGDVAALDASGSKAIAGANLVATNWNLCQLSYKPAATGIALTNPSACPALTGYAASGSEFKFPTCNLAAGDYAARLTLVDSNNKIAGEDVKVHVLPESYDDPATRMRMLAAAFSALQSQQFLAFFDESYAGLSVLQENIRNTFAKLSSMNINLRVSQANVNCNDVTLRADWDQKYTFSQDQTCANVQPGVTCQPVVFTQTEQLTVRMKRTPGKGWYITDFQGDNGTVQGTPPGPQSTDIALPDLQITSLVPTTTTGAVKPMIANGATPAVIGLQSGPNRFVATVVNSGTADLTTQPGVRFSLRDSTGNEIAVDMENVPLPLAAGASVQVAGTLNIPTLAPGQSVKITANVNNGCVVQEKNCDGSDIQTIDVILGSVDLAINAVTPSATLIAGVQGTVNVTVANNGQATSLASSGNLVVTSTNSTATLGTANIPAINPASSVVVPVTIIGPPAGSTVLTARINPAAAGDINQANDSLGVNVSVVPANIDLQASNLTVTPTTPVVSGQAGTLTFLLKNVGPIASAVGSYTCSLATSRTSTVISSGSTPSVAANGQTTIQANFTVPTSTSTVSYVGTDNVSCTVTQDPNELSSAVANNTTSGISVVVGANSDLVITSATISSSTLQVGSPATLTVVVQNNGLDTAAGYDLLLTTAGVQRGQVFGPALPGGTNTTLTINFPTPADVAAPGDITENFTLTVNSNGAVAETNTANNTATVPVRVVDFTLTVIPQTTLVFTAGQNIGNVSVIQVQPSTYPLPLLIQYTNLPTGFIPSGNFNEVLTGVPSATAGIIPVGASATVNGVTHSAPTPIQIQVNAPQQADLAITSFSTTSVRSFTTNPWLFGEPLDFNVVVTNNGPGPSNGGEQLTINLDNETVLATAAVPVSLASGQSTTVTMHAVAPQFSGATLFANVAAPAVGDANLANNSGSLPVTVSNWHVVFTPPGDSDSTPLTIAAGSSGSGIFSLVVDAGGTPVGGTMTVQIGAVSSRLTATSSTSTLAVQPTKNRFAAQQGAPSVSVTAAANAATGIYIAQVLVSFVDGGQTTATRQATLHISVSNPNTPGDTVTVTSNPDITCPVSGCVGTLQLNGPLVDKVALSVTRSGGTTGSVDLHFTDPFNVVSNVTQAGQPQSSIINGLPYGTPRDVFFGADLSSGSISAGGANVIVSATSIQTSAMNGSTTPDPTGPTTTLNIQVGDIFVNSGDCISLAPGAAGNTQFTLFAASGFNIPNLAVDVPTAALPPGVTLGSFSTSATLSGSLYSPVTISLTNNNTTALTPQFMVVTFTATNAYGSATKAFALEVILDGSACPIPAAANLDFGGATITGRNGAWKRGTVSGSMVRTSTQRSVAPPAATAAMPDLRINPQDVSYTPSMPQPGDTVQVRFRISNAGDADAHDVPVALQVNGVTVASDTFSVRAGHTTLAGLEWNTANAPRSVASTMPAFGGGAPQPVMRGRLLADDIREVGTGMRRIGPNQMARAMLVVDPNHTLAQKSALQKSAALAHFELAAAPANTPASFGPGAVGGATDRAMLELADGTCAGFRFSSGARADCESADVAISVEDLGSNRLTLSSLNGVADLGISGDPRSMAARASFTNKVALTASHSYAVQVAGGKIGIITVQTVSNPQQLTVASAKKFGTGRKIVRGLGGDGQPIEVGDLGGGAKSSAIVTLVLAYQQP